MRALPAALALVVCLLASLVALSFAFTPTEEQAREEATPYGAESILGEQPETIDVIFLGNSVARSAISPMQIWSEQGLSTYVVAKNGLRLPQALTALRKATQYQNPQLVVIDVNMLFDPYSLGDIVYEYARTALPVFDYHNRWKLAVTDNPAPLPYAADEIEMKGYYISQEVVPAASSEYMIPTDDATPMASRYLWSFDRILDYCDAIDVDVLLISVPSAKSWNYCHANAVQTIAQERGLSFIDLNLQPNQVPIDWTSETRDGGDHLNLSGASKVSAYLGEYLTEHYELPDHRGEDAYHSWDEAYEQYERLTS